MSDVWQGACHCGAIGYIYRTKQHPSEWSVHACQCAFCLGHGARSICDPQGALEFSEHSPGHLNRYRFAQRTADFLVCRNCGVYLGALISTARGDFGIINIGAMRDLPASLAAPVATNHDAENLETRIARREQHWTPVARTVWPLAGANTGRRNNRCKSSRS